MSLMNKLTQLTKSEKGKELIDKAQAMANDPKNREKLEAARGKVEQSLDAAKHKLAEKRGEKGTTAPVSQDATPDPAAEAAVDSAAEATTPPQPPAYDGDDGPKAA